MGAVARWSQSLLGKALLALVAVCVLTLVPLSAIGWQAMEAARSHFGEAYARNFAELTAENIREPISRDLALARRLADSIVLAEWLLDPDDPAKHERFFHEIESYRNTFIDQNYFVASALEPFPYYSHDDDRSYSEAPRYELDPDAAEDSWFFNTIAGDDVFNINVDPNPEIEVTRVWINVVVDPRSERLGVVGTGFDLTGFLERFVDTDEPGLTPIVIDADGAIQAHPDPERIAYNVVGADDIDDHQRIQSLLDPSGRASLDDAMTRARGNGSDTVPIFETSLEGQERLFAMRYIEELDWYVLGAVDVRTANVVDGPWLRFAGTSIVATLALMLFAFGYAVHRLVIDPIQRLRHSASAIAEGDYRVSLPAARRDEIGDLSHAFDIMTQKVKSHTEELEHKVHQRTHELETANREMAAAQRKVNDSIDYAGIIQRALLPDAQLAEQLGEHHFVLWHPRDGVGGDFYLFRSEGERYLVGVVDCAGHGVPGALMTMLARAAFDDAINRLGIDSPAALLEHADATLREMLQHSEMPSSVATNLDAGLALVDPDAARIRFAGAKIGLHWSDGDRVDEIPGGRRALCDRRRSRHTNHEVATAPGVTWYMVTDGYLDQAGGELGLGLGNTQFRELLREHAGLPMDQQADALERALATYRGDHEQRDDITVLAFRVR